MTGATLFRRNGPSWRFEWDHSAQHYIHRTVRGTVYVIFGINECKPLWIGRKIGNAWCTVEADIGAEYIRFDNGGEYWFRRPSE